MGKTKSNQTNKRGKKKLFIILGVLLAVIVALVIVISIIASKNMKAMNRCIDAALNELKANYPVTSVDAGEYSELKMYGIMKFDVEQYNIEEVGNLSIMRVNMGVMQMGTLVITPQDKNLPLLSTDYMYILGNRKAYLEFYDVVKEKDDTYQQLLTSLSEVQDKYDYLENVEVTPAWYAPLLTVTSYKSGSFDTDTDLQGMLVDSIQAYLAHSKQLPALTDAQKAEKLAITVEYTDGLIENGGISTDVFKDQLGAEETKKFFDNVFFGTAVE